MGWKKEMKYKLKAQETYLMKSLAENFPKSINDTDTGGI
jgi:hypothetical protein